MNSDERTVIPDCDPEIRNKGTIIFIGAPLDGRAQQVEDRAKTLAKDSGARVDWHYAGGRVCVLALGDREAIARVVSAARSKWPRWTSGYTTDLEEQP